MEERNLTLDLKRRQLVTSINEHHWYHSFKLDEKLSTNGESEINPQEALDALNVPQNLEGKIALDVGGWDGPLSFALEERGATVFCIDVQNPRRTGFILASNYLNSKVRYFEGSVYDLDINDFNNVDLVVFRGVYYHLRNPLLALTRIAATLKIGGILYFEGEGIIDYIEDRSGNPVTLSKENIEFLQSDVPLVLACPNLYKGASNWSIPNKSALISWLTSSGFKIEMLNEYLNERSQRFYGYAVKIEVQKSPEHPLY